MGGVFFFFVSLFLKIFSPPFADAIKRFLIDFQQEKDTTEDKQNKVKKNNNPKAKNNPKENQQPQPTSISAGVESLSLSFRTFLEGISLSQRIQLYGEYIRQKGNWGGQLEIQIVADVYQVVIEVWNGKTGWGNT